MASHLGAQSTGARKRPIRRAPKSAQFVVELGSLRKGTSGPRVIEAVGHLPEVAVSGSKVDPDEPIYLDATVEAVHEGMLVSGSVRTRWHGACRRCLEEATGELKASFRELCMEGGDEETTYPLGAETLELDPIVYDACILDLPLAPLCSEDCLGLCPQCGKNRNVEACTCAAPTDPRWAGLEVLEHAGQDDEAQSADLRTD